MPWIINALGWLIGLFTRGGSIFGIFAYFGSKIKSIAFAIGVQSVVVYLVISLKIAFIVLAFQLVLWLYNQIHYILDNLQINFNGNELSTLAYNFFSSFGIIEAFKTTFSTFSFLFVTVFTLILIKLFLRASQTLSNELFKLGVLLGQ